MKYFRRKIRIHWCCFFSYHSFQKPLILPCPWNFTFQVLETWHGERKSNTEMLSFRKKTIEVSTGNSETLRSGWKSSLLEDFWGKHIYYYCNFHILPKVQRKWGHNRQEAQNCNFLCIKMTLKGFLKQEWKMVYLFIEYCFKIPSRKRQVTHNRESHVTFPRTCWCWSHTLHTPQECSLSSVEQPWIPCLHKEIPKERYGEGA